MAGTIFSNNTTIKVVGSVGQTQTGSGTTTYTIPANSYVLISQTTITAGSVAGFLTTTAYYPGGIYISGSISATSTPANSAGWSGVLFTNSP